MSDEAAGPFDHIPPTPGGHFVINLYAAIYRLIHQTRRFAELAGGSLDEVFERFPFLGEYFNEMRSHMPEDITWETAGPWWQQQIGLWEERCEGHLPLAALAHQSGLSFASRLAFMAVGLVEEDSRFGTLLAELQAPLTHRRPTLEVTGQMMMVDGAPGGADPWTICRPLISAGLIEVQNVAAPRSEWLLRVPPVLWDAVRGDVADQPAPWCRFHWMDAFPEVGELVFEPAFVDRLAEIPNLILSGRARRIIVRRAPGAEGIEVMGAIARALGRNLITVDGRADAPENGGRIVAIGDGRDQLAGDAASLLGPLASLACAIPCITYDLGPGDTADVPALTGYAGPIGLILGNEGGLGSASSEHAVTITLPPPRAALRARHWQRALGAERIDDLDAIADRFHLSGDFIRRVAGSAAAHAALDRRERVTLDDVREASRTLNRQMLDTLAGAIPAKGSWQDLVSVQTTRDKLMELERRCRYRERLLDRLGPAFGTSGNTGVRALFTGASGTGKTLAARILAAVLGMDLYRVDLAAVVNKYIGETEKNLHQVLSRAEALDVVLLLDEGDALLGQRTEVKSANDRYANLETNYLLQRLEHYQGIVLVTTNLGDNIDQAFQRRMDVVVPFFPPQAEERLRILDLHLPVDHDVAADALEWVALRCLLTGSQIRNAVLHATLIAMEDGTPLATRHLEAGLRSEYRKSGGVCPLEINPVPGAADGGVSSFVEAFARG